VIKRWRNLFGGGVLLERYLAGQCKTGAELDKARPLCIDYLKHFINPVLGGEVFRKRITQQ
jgi:hypothetical protein